MRAFQRLTLAAFAVFAVTAIAPALAQDVFIRPNSGSSGRPSVDYGIQPRPQAPAPVESPAQPIQPAQPAPLPEPTAPIPTPRQPEPVPSLPTTPQPAQDPGGASVFKVDPDPPPPPGSGPNSITIAFQGGQLGAHDYGTIAQSLGLDNKEIAANCSLHYGAMVSLNNNEGVFLPVHAVPAVKYNFQGGLSGLDIATSAACKKVKKPVSGMIIEQNNNYMISLASFTCPQPKNGTGNIAVNFRYTGDGGGDCRYQ